MRGTLTPDLNNVCEAVNCFEKATTTIDGLTHKDALAKIHNDHDHLPGFTERNIRRYLPANNPNIPRRVRTSCPKNSMTETCERTFSDTKHNDDANIDNIIGRQSVSNSMTFLVANHLKLLTRQYKLKMLHRRGILNRI